ncbi:dehydrogenase/reductase SDR family member 12-like [Ornithodoros turicata]|uniref:dehydrogenase/reductase SDR family member 12-like n=1 Tax=Ornithodoros turicata TaxID=34597 RepID=UPI003139D7C4
MASLYRNMLWFAKGMKEYSRGGFQSACRSFDLLDLDVDCTGKVFMVTGATGTLGRVVVMELAKKGGIVHVVCQHKDRGESLKELVAAATSKECIYIHVVDLSSVQEAASFAKSFANTHSALNVLVNCVSAMSEDREIGADGIEKTFATNTLGLHLLISNLVPLLNESYEPRVVIVTCGCLLMHKLNPTDLQFEQMFPYDGVAAFAQTKRQQVVMTEHYAEAYPGIHFSAMHPGWLEPNGVKAVVPKVLGKINVSCRTVEEAVDTVLWLAISRAALKHSSGMFFQDRKTTCPHLPLGKTKTSLEDEKYFMRRLHDFVKGLNLE